MDTNKILDWLEDGFLEFGARRLGLCFNHDGAKAEMAKQWTPINTNDIDGSGEKKGC